MPVRKSAQLVPFALRAVVAEPELICRVTDLMSPKVELSIAVKVTERIADCDDAINHIDARDKLPSLKRFEPSDLGMMLTCVSIEETKSSNPSS